MTSEFRLTINGSQHVLPCPQKRTLLDVLRADLHLTGTRYGCGMGQCGACTVLLDGKPARACVMRATRAANHEITTLEGLADSQTGALSPVQQGFLECEGAQCGYCLNGMVMSATALLAENPCPTRDEIRSMLRHNLCRCGAHLEIIASVERAAKLLREAAP